MWLFLVPFCLAIFSSPLISASKPHFFITVPTNLPQGAEEKACVTFLDLKGAVDLKLELKKEDKVHFLAEYKIDVHDDHFECYPFKVPVIKDLRPWLLHVTAHGEDISWDGSEPVFIIEQDICIIQTDKLVYKPGDIVKFRLISVDHHFHISHKIYPVVEIIDSSNHRIAQWLNVSTNNGFADFSFHLANELPLEEYKINVPSSCEKYFEVEEYVSKRFNVDINSPLSIAEIDKSFQLEVCGRYTYGEPVEGSIDLSICAKSRGRFWHRSDTSSEEDEDDNCINVKKAKTNSKGCVSKDINLGIFNFTKSGWKKLLDIKTKLTEDKTGHTEKASASVKLKMHKNIKFLEKLHNYYKGFPLHSKVKVTDEKDQPISDQTIYLHAADQTDSFKTDENGIAHFTLNTSTWDSIMNLRASLSSDDEDDDNKYPDDHLFLIQFYSQSESIFSLKTQSKEIECDSEYTVTAEYDIQRNALDPDTDHLHFYYLLRTKDGILLYKEHTVDITSQTNNPTVHGSFPIKFQADANLYPFFMLIAFSILPNGETIASAAPPPYEMPLCLKDKVQLKFSEEQVLPGESVNLEVSAKAGSLCSIRSVDKGYLLQKPPKSLLPVEYTELSYSVESKLRKVMVFDRERHQCPENEMPEFYERFPVFDVNTIFKFSALNIFTNTHVRRPVKCVPSGLGARSGTKVKKPGDKDKVERKHFTRSHFPDTWLFDLVPVGSDGHTVLNRTTPHTITKWVTDAFCLSKSGFARVGDVELTTFQPYFIDLIHPYSVIQGEKFTIQAMVFSYVKKCILIVVSLSDSEDLAAVQNKEQARCVCEGHSHSFSWDVTAVKPKTLQIHVDSGSLELDGKCTEDPVLIKNDQRKDSVEKTIVVKPRGHEEEKTQTFLFYPSESKEDVHITLNLPERLVAGSERAHVIIQGDLMANIVANLDNVLDLPNGCGEQNVAKLVRGVYTLEYLKGVQELTPEKKAAIIELLIQAYQKQLTYRNESGSYGFFRDQPNFWVTALVVKTFANAQDWIYIDEKHIKQAVEWLQSLQLPDGSFREEGNSINNKIEANNDVARTAYVVMSLLEPQRAYGGSIVEKALGFLRKSVDGVTSAHTQALLAYTFTLSGDTELRDQILKKLENVKVGMKEVTKHKKTDPSHAGETEMASYILLALLSDKTTATKNLDDSTNIIRWIVSHQNPYGGFQSSQDTTMGIQALAKYASVTKPKKGDSTVTIRSISGFERMVHVDKDNSVLLQTVDLPKIPGEYTVSYIGNGFVYLQLHEHYHVLPNEAEIGHFSLNVSTTPSDCTDESQRKFEIRVDISYSGKRENTNMAMIQVEPISGYIPDRHSLRKLKQNPTVKRTEVSPHKISIYLEKLTHSSESFVFSWEQETKVENLQPATVFVYDYYNPEEHTVVEYNAPCSAEFKKTEHR